MNLTLIAPPTTRGAGQSVVGADSHTVYPQFTVGVLENVTPADAQALIAAGYQPMGLPVLFGTGAPTVTGVEGQSYYDTAAAYAAYVFHGAAWEALPGGGATEVTAVLAGAGIAVDQPAGNVTVTNDGVTGLAAGAGIGVDAATGNVTITNAGVTGIAAGAGILVDAATGDVTVSAGAPLHALVAGGAAGNIAVTAIKLGDRLDQVIEYVYVAGVTTDVLDLTGEFTITADGTINNTGGSDTTGNKLLVNWTKLTP